MPIDDTVTPLSALSRARRSDRGRDESSPSLTRTTLHPPLAAMVVPRQPLLELLDADLEPERDGRPTARDKRVDARSELLPDGAHRGERLHDLRMVRVVDERNLVVAPHAPDELLHGRLGLAQLLPFHRARGVEDHDHRERRVLARARVGVERDVGVEGLTGGRAWTGAAERHRAVDVRSRERDGVRPERPGGRPGCDVPSGVSTWISGVRSPGNGCGAAFARRRKSPPAASTTTPAVALRRTPRVPIRVPSQLLRSIAMAFTLLPVAVTVERAKGTRICAALPFYVGPCAR